MFSSIGKVGDASEFNYTRRSWDNESMADVVYKTLMSQRLPEPLPSIAFSMVKRDGYKALMQTYNFLIAYYDAIRAFPERRYYGDFDINRARIAFPDDVLKVFNTAASRYGYNRFTMNIRNQVLDFIKKSDNFDNSTNFAMFYPVKILDGIKYALSQISG